MSRLRQASDLTLKDNHGKKADEYQGPYDYEGGRNCLDKNPATMALLSLQGREYWQHSLQKALSENPLSVFEVADDRCHIAFHAISEGDLTVFTQLLALGLTTDKSRGEAWLNQREVRGLSVLHYCMFRAIFSNQDDFLKVLLETSKRHGVKLVDKPSFMGSTAQQMALTFDRVDLAQLLQEVQAVDVLVLFERAPEMITQREKNSSSTKPDCIKDSLDLQCVV